MTAPFLRITLTLEGETIIDRLLQGIEERANDLTPVWPEVLAVFRQQVREAFASEGGSTDSGPWPALAKRTQQERRRLGFGPAHPILERSGRLKMSLTTEEGASVIASPNRLQIASDVPYFAYHQSREPRTRLPRRAPVSLTTDQKTELLRPIRLYLTGRDTQAPRRSSLR